MMGAAAGKEWVTRWRRAAAGCGPASRFSWVPCSACCAMEQPQAHPALLLRCLLPCRQQLEGAKALVLAAIDALAVSCCRGGTGAACSTHTPSVGQGGQPPSVACLSRPVRHPPPLLLEPPIHASIHPHVQAYVRELEADLGNSIYFHRLYTEQLLLNARAAQR